MRRILPSFGRGAHGPPINELAGREVRLSNPGKVYFPKAGVTKGELVNYYVEWPTRRSSTCASARR